MDPHPPKREPRKSTVDPSRSTPELRLFVELYGSLKSGAEGAPGPGAAEAAAEAPEVPDEVRKAGSLPANRLGRYTRTEPLGEGGMSEVWKAWDHSLSRWVALKFLKHDVPELHERFKREALTVARLNHPNIAAIYEVETAGARPYIVMQYVPGVTLRQCPRTNRRLLIALIRDAAAAIHTAHLKGVIHRDLKPDNLMVEGDPGNVPKTRWRRHSAESSVLRLYVMDFGLAKESAAPSAHSRSGSLVGTPAYMSPEQARGDPRIDARTDIYALGPTLYELVSGRPPFQAVNVYDLLKQVVEDPPLPLRSGRSKVDRDLETILLKCLQKEPSRRYRTALDLADDLDRWLSGKAIKARPIVAARGRRAAGDDRLRERAATVMRHQSALLKLAKMDNSGKDFVLQVTEESGRALEVERVSVWLFDESHTRLVCRDLFRREANAHESGAVLESSRFPRYFVSQEASRVVAATDARKDPRTSEFADSYLIPLGITSMMDVPIRIRGRLVGVVCHEHTGRKRRWSLEEQQFASSIADQMALSFEASERLRAEEELSRLKGRS
ncbi:MAG TPA: protein kinase [Planctomycetota bacterium]|nr:protein kinase [Planctomycetota bacterium]